MAEADRLNSEAVRLYQAGKYVEAMPLAEKALALRQSALAPDEPNVAASLITLGRLFEATGRYSDAEAHYKRSLAIREKVLGPTHVEVATSINTLASLLIEINRSREAIGLLQRSQKILDQLPYPANAKGAAAMDQLGHLFWQLDLYAEAEAAHTKSIATYEFVEGVNSANLAYPLSGLAQVYQSTGRLDEAEKLFRRGLAIALSAHGPKHRKVKFIQDSLAILAERRITSEEMERRGSFRANRSTRQSSDEQQFESQMKAAISANEQKLGRKHPEVARGLGYLGDVYASQNRNAEAEKSYRAALRIYQDSFGEQHLKTGVWHSYLGALHLEQSNWIKARDHLRMSAHIVAQELKRLPSSRRDALAAQRISGSARAQFPIYIKSSFRAALLDQEDAGLEATGTFEGAQLATESSSAAALLSMATRLAAVDDGIGSATREVQDLIEEWRELDARRSEALIRPPASRHPSEEVESINRLAEIENGIASRRKVLADRFPEFDSLTSPKPISVADAHVSLRDGEALVLFLDTDDRFKPLPEETFVWVVTKTDMKWVRSDLGTGALQREVTALRCGLDASAWPDSAKWSEATDEDRRRKLAQQARRDACIKATGVTVSDDALPPFDAARAHALYNGLFGEVEDLIRGKHLLVVPSGPLTQLPLQVLVTEPPAPDTALKDIAWLGARQPITVLPSAASLKALRRDAKPSRASEPFLGFGNPVLAGNPNCGKITIPDRCPNDPAPAAQAASRMLGRLVASLNTVTAYFTRSGQADVESVRKLCPLPDSAHELSCVAKSLGAGADSMVIGPAMTEPAVRRAKLDRYRVLHFATHGLLAGEMSAMAKGKAEPALVFTPPEVASDEDDGLLTASEITTLKLDADWVVMSACNTAAGGASGAEALSGLAKAFFYAGARALLVSHWPVNSYAATMLTSTTFAELKRDPKIGRAEAFRRAMVALINDKVRSWAAHPSIWAPFVVVGEGGAG